MKKIFSSSKLKNAINSYKTFNWFKHDKILHGKIPLKTGDKLIYIGSVSKLWYKSSKIDKQTRIHMHSFPGPLMAFTNIRHNLIVIVPVSMSYRGLL